jgi:hypothetical protein
MERIEDRMSNARERQDRGPWPQRAPASLIPPPIDEPAGVVDEVQAWYLVRAERDGWVYTSVLRQLINRMYRERDYLAQRKRDGRRTAYDYAVDRDQVALAWAIRELVRLMPAEEKARPEPPRPPRKPKHRLSAAEKAMYRGVPSWNAQPKRGWAGIELPPRPSRRSPPAGGALDGGGGSVSRQQAHQREHPRADAEEQSAQPTRESQERHPGDP